MKHLVVAIAMLGGLVSAQSSIDYLGSWSFNEAEAELVEVCERQLDIRVNYTPFSGTGVADLMTELRGLATARRLPDVFWMSSGFVDEFAADGLLYNLQPLVDRDVMPESENWNTGAFDAARTPDKTTGDMHAFPIYFVETVLYYNKAMFDEAGLEYPTATWTWDDFLTAAQALTKDDNDDGLIDQYGYYGFGRYAHVESWVYQNGGALLNATRDRFEPNEQAVEAINFMNALINEYQVAPQPAEMAGIDNPFHAGLAAMWIDGSWAINGNRDIEDLNFGIAAVPRGPSWQEDVAYGWSDMVAISATSDDPEAAWALVQCLAGPERTVARSGTSSIPIWRAVADSEAWLEPDQLPENKAFLLEWADNAGPNSFTPGWGEWRGYVGGAGLQGQLDEAFNGNQTVEEALAAATEVANTVLARFYR